MPTINLDHLTLNSGAHPSIEAGACLLEAASYVAGEPWTDHPQCVSPVLGSFGRNLNDALPDDRRQELKPYIPRLIGTADDGKDETRSYIALDWLIRTYTPAFLDLAGLTGEAAELRNLRRIVDIVAARQAGPVVRRAREKAAAAWDAARDAAGNAAWAAARDAAWDAAGNAAGNAARAAAWAAAWDAAGDAARAAAGDAAWAAAWDAAWAAAWDAAGDAAWAAAGNAAGNAARDAARAAAWAAAWDAARAAAGNAARDAARDALKPTVDSLQSSAIALLGTMIDGQVTA
jgi:hypothetical protein